MIAVVTSNRLKRAVPLCLLVLAAACGRAESPALTEIHVRADPRGLTEDTTNLGYVVQLTDARMVLQDIELFVGGQPHGLSWQRLYRELIAPVAYAHPEHLYGGELAGGMRGRYVVDWLHQERSLLGLATLRVDHYASANFRFARAGIEDGLSATDTLLGHTAVLSGTATRDGVTRTFTVMLDAPVDRVLVGAPFDVEVTTEAPGELGFQLLSVDPFEGDSLFDDVDFALLDRDNDTVMELREDTGDVDARDAYFAVRRRFQTHDHFRIEATY